MRRQLCLDHPSSRVLALRTPCTHRRLAMILTDEVIDRKRVRKMLSTTSRWPLSPQAENGDAHLVGLLCAYKRFPVERLRAESGTRLESMSNHGGMSSSSNIRSVVMKTTACSVWPKMSTCR